MAAVEDGTTGLTGACKNVSASGVGKVVSYVHNGTDTTSIKTATASQPNSVAIEADTTYFPTYTSGVLTNAAACGTTLDHAVVAVGYGSDATAG
jgi:cathepsin L